MKKFRAISVIILGLVLIMSTFYMPTNIAAFSFTEATTFYLEEGLNETGATNIIAAIITDFRAFDTLGETLVLFTAILAVVTVLRPIKGKSHE